MRTSLKAVFLILLSFSITLSAACHSPVAEQPEPPKEQPTEPLPTPSELPEQPFEPVPAPLEQFWNTDDVDISDVDLTKNHIAFTFDDSPAKTLERIVGVFVNYNKKNPDCPASSTVFCNCAYLNERTVAPLQAAFAAGFELGNHSYSHKNLTELESEELSWELDENDRLLKGIDGKALHLLRAPYGRLDEQVKEIAKTPIIDWYVDTLDWTGKSADEIYETVFSQKADGVIVLMHDGYESTVEALKRLLPDLKVAGYQVLSVSQMAKVHHCPLRVGGVYTRVRKKTS